MMNTEKPRIAILVSDTNPGGVETLVRLLIQEIDRSQYTVVVVAFGPGPVGDELGRAADEYHNLGTGSKPVLTKFRDGRYRMDFWALPKLLLWLVRSVWQMAFWLRQNHIALIHSHISAFSLIGGLAGRITGVPLLWHVHCPLKHSNILGSWLATRFIANSHFITRQIHSSWRKKTTVVLNCTDVDAIASNQRTGELRRIVGMPDFSKLVGVVALATPRKGLPRFVEMAAKLAPQKPDVHFVIVAGLLDEMSERILSELKEQSSAAGIGEQTHIVRDLKNARFYMGDMDAFFMCSLKGTEPFGLVVTEAMAAGVPVVAFDNDAMPEIIEDQKTGFLVPEGDMDAAAAKIREILDDRKLSARLTEAACERVRSQFDIPVFIQRIQDVYEKTLKQAHR